MAIKTRLLKAQCGECAYTVRITRKWLEVGVPSCPCGAGALECADWDDILEERERERASWESTFVAVVREARSVILRKPGACSACGGEVRRGDEVCRMVLTEGGGSPFNYDRCASCADSASRARGYDAAFGDDLGRWREGAVTAADSRG